MKRLKEMLPKTEVTEAVLNTAQRRKRGAQMRRRKAQVARMRKIAMRRFADSGRIKNRAVRGARTVFKKRFAGGKSYSKLGTAQKITVDKRLEKMRGAIAKVATRITPEIRRKELTRKRFSENVNLDFQSYFSEAMDRGQTSKIDQLVRLGLADKSMLNVIKRSLSKVSSGETLNPAERKSVENLVGTLVDIVTSSDAMFRMTKSQLQKESAELNELSYKGNIGAMEMIKFFQKASDAQIKQMKALIAANKNEEAWKLLQDVTGTKLQEAWEVREDDSEMEYDDDEEEDSTETDGLDMMCAELSEMMDDVEAVYDIVEGLDEEPDAWIQSKVTLAADYISNVRDYLEYYHDDEDEYEDEEEDGEYDDIEVAEAFASMSKSDFTEEEYAEIGEFHEELQALKRKSDKSGIPFKVIKEVYDRGLNSYEGRSNLSESQWAFARVNSFISNGKTDEDLKEAMEWGTDELRIAYAQATPGQSTEIIDARYSANAALTAMNNANTQRIKKVFEETDDGCGCDDCEDGLYEDIDFKQILAEAEYDGKKVDLNKPFRTPDGPKKFAVYTMGPNGKVVIVRFGDPNMEIKRDDPGRRANFRARHNCDDPGPKWKARYWSCYQWRSSSKVED